ncbi:unnamed protein product [Thelazia callipaeda]|uniref:Autophagy-related protein 9 n=1 Tax=Thelazia callipaeda TaxID=103827 RepID=A0A0N5CQ93_THECL|nr:unnamed protein product [Thelazia callipaeda]
MFGFRSKTGYLNIDEEASHSQTYDTDQFLPISEQATTPNSTLFHENIKCYSLDSESKVNQYDFNYIFMKLQTSFLFLRAYVPSDVYGSPPLEHGIATSDEDQTVACHAATSSSILWDRVENLDQFFTRVYEYHQNGGYLCIVIKHILTLLQFIFVVWFVAFLLTRVDYDVLFRNKNVTADEKPVKDKIRFNDVIYSDWNRIDVFTLCLLIFAVLFWIFRAARVCYQIHQFGEIRKFYYSALGINDDFLTNLKWSEVVQRICEKQPSIHLILNKDGITALDLYQRILRHKARGFFSFYNYFIALVNKEILPPVINLPFIGSMPYLPNGLKMNLEWLLFYGVWSPWKGPYELKDEYKHSQNISRLGMIYFWIVMRFENISNEGTMATIFFLANELESGILKMAIGNFIFSPLVFIYQVLYFFFTYGELLKRDPSSFTMRRYSNFGRSKLRHFNELDHELRLRLSRSHRAATQYMEQFISPLGHVIARKVQFVASAVFVVLVGLGLWDEDVLTIEHVLTVISVSGLTAVICQGFTRDENVVYCPETLLTMVISQIHYAPDSWKGKAHTGSFFMLLLGIEKIHDVDNTNIALVLATVRKEFSHLFELKAQFLLKELLSPFLTPLVLLFWIRPKAKELVNFFHNFTISVEGLGDVCSFAQMDIKQHGDPSWSFENGVNADETPKMSPKVQANDGKIELSLINFVSNHPQWKPPALAARFLDDIRNRMEHDMNTLRNGNVDNNMLLESIHSVHPFIHMEQQRWRKLRSYQPFIASLYDSDFLGTPSRLFFHVFFPENGEIIDMDITPQMVALSIAYLRNLHAHCESHNLEAASPQITFARSHSSQISPFVATTAAASSKILGLENITMEAVGDIWDVPSQSVITKCPVSFATQAGNEPLLKDHIDDPLLPGLSDNILDV